MTGAGGEGGKRGPSRQRRAVLRAAAALGRAFSVDDLAREARRLHPGIGLATVYRAVAALCGQDLLEPVARRDGRTLYARCSGAAAHHHHAVCMSCGTVSEAGCPVDELTLAQAVGGGFVVTRHEMSLYGLCGHCAAMRAEES